MRSSTTTTAGTARVTVALAAATLAAALGLAACAGDPDAFYPGTASGERLIEERALARVPPQYRPVSVTVVRQWGRRSGGAFGGAWGGFSVGSDLGSTEVIGYDAWVRVEGCKGYVLVRFDAWGRHRTTGDLTKDCG